MASPKGLAIFWVKKWQVPWQVPFLNYPELGQFRNIFCRFYLLHYSENNKDQTNAHRSSSMDKAGADHYAGNSYNQPDRAKEKDS